MPKQDPLPKPPDLPDQLTDSEEMERVLKEHLSAPSEPATKSLAVPPVPVTRNLLPSTDRPDPVLAESQDPIFSSNEQVLERVRQVTELAFGEAVDLNSDPNNPNITSSAFFELFKDRSVEEIDKFLEEFFKDYPVGSTLPSYLNDLLTVPILKPSSNNDEYQSKAQNIVRLVDEYITIMKRYGFDDSEVEVTYIDSADLLDDSLVINGQWKQMHYMVEANVDLAAVKVVGLIANRVARVIAAALINKNRSAVSKFPKTLVDSSGTVMGDNLVDYAQYEASGIIARQLDASLLDPYAPVIGITLEGGMFLGCFTDKDDNKDKFVFYLPKPLSDSSGSTEAVK